MVLKMHSSKEDLNLKTFASTLKASKERENQVQNKWKEIKLRAQVIKLEMEKRISEVNVSFLEKINKVIHF